MGGAIEVAYYSHQLKNAHLKLRNLVLSYLPIKYPHYSCIVVLVVVAVVVVIIIIIYLTHPFTWFFVQILAKIIEMFFVLFFK